MMEQINNLINEELHSFDDQYALSYELSDIIYDMAKSKILRNVYYTSNNKTINIVDIIIEFISYGQFSSYISGIDSENKKIILNIIIPQNIMIIQNKEMVIKALSKVIAHELMHGNIFFNRADNELVIEDYPEYYLPSLKIIRSGAHNNIINDIADALYSTYYQEMASFISQTTENLKLLMHQRNIINPNNEQIKTLIYYTESFAKYKKFITNVVPFLNHASNEQLKFVVEVFKENGFNCNIDFFRKKSKEIEKLSHIALKKIMRNAMLTIKDIKK